MNYKKITMSASMIAFVSALVFGGTQAFFSDEETSTGNTFTAGEIDLTVDSVAHYNGLICFESQWVPDDAVDWNGDDEELVANQDIPDAIDDFNAQNPNHYPAAGTDCGGTWEMTDLGPEHTFFDFGDLKPGDEGENTISLHLETNDGYVCAIIDNLVDNDNGLTEPEEEDGDNTGGDGEGELSSEIRFFAWADDGDNIWEDGEAPLFSNTEGPASDVIDGVVYDIFTPANGLFMPAGSTAYLGLYWCYGDIDVNEDTNTITCDGSSASNITQTDSMTADISFYVEQTRNNEDFVCPEIETEPEPVDETIVVRSSDLAADLDDVAGDPTSWFFYNDESDVIDNALGSFAVGPDTPPEGIGSAAISVTGTERRNLATYQFAGTPLADITELAFSTYNPSAGNGGSADRSAYLNFNIDFDGDDDWQNRLVFVPNVNGSVTQDTWQEWDAIDGGAAMWSWSGFVANGNMWPDGNTDVNRSWSDLITAFPSIRVRVSDPWLGMRVGEPYADGYSENLDAFKFGTAGGTKTFDFEPSV